MLFRSEAANAAGLPASNVVRLGIPDRFIEHGERGELLAELGLDAEGICRTVRRTMEMEDPAVEMPVRRDRVAK